MYYLVKKRGDDARMMEDGGDTHHHHHVHHHHHAGEQVEGKAHAMDHKYGDSVDEILDELVRPPASWAAYGTDHAGLMAIIGMEYAELMAAKAEGNMQKIEEELEDLAAACIHAHKHM